MKNNFSLKQLVDWAALNALVATKARIAHAEREGSHLNVSFMDAAITNGKVAVPDYDCSELSFHQADREDCPNPLYVLTETLMYDCGSEQNARMWEHALVHGEKAQRPSIQSFTDAVIGPDNDFLPEEEKAMPAPVRTLAFAA